MLRALRDKLAALLPTVLALFVFAVGCINIVSALILIRSERLQAVLEALPLEVTHSTRTLTVLSGLLLMMLSYSLYRRKRRGWLAATLLLAGSVVFHLIKGLDYEEASLSLLALLALLASRRYFTVRSDAGGYSAALLLGLSALSGGIAYGLLGFLLLQHHFIPAFSYSRALQSSLALLSLLAEPSLQPSSGHRDALWFSDSLASVGFFTMLYVSAQIIRPVAARLRGDKSARAEALALWERYGRGGLAYFTLTPGLQYAFGPARQSYLAFRVVNGFALVLGAPIGEGLDRQTLVQEFRQLCRDNDWRPVWFQVCPEDLALLQVEGSRAFLLGDEAIVDLSVYSLSGKAAQSIRTARNHLLELGYSCQWYDLGAEPSRWRHALERVSQEWLKKRGGREMAFSLGTWQSLLRRGSEQRLMLLLNRNGEPEAFVSFTPIPNSGAAGQRDWSLDLMRRADAAASGAMEFLLSEALLSLRAEGCQCCSLSLSPLSEESGTSVAEPPDLVAQGRALAYKHLGRVYNFAGLHNFKRKFQPRWEPRYLLFPGWLSLPQVLIALVRAHIEPAGWSSAEVEH